MVEPSFLALTSTPSIAPSSLDDTNPVRAACARAPLDIDAAASRATAAPSQRCRPRMDGLPMNRSSMPGLSRDLMSGGSAAATIGRRWSAAHPMAHEKMTARATGAMVRRAAGQQTSPTVWGSANYVQKSMSEDGKRLSDVIAAIDAANARDPNEIAVGGQLQPAELVYGRRMSATRARYAAGRVGYLKWRKDLQGFHARRIGEIMTAAGYDASDVARVGALIRKERLKSDAEAQMIEDVACVVFLEHYLADFLAKTDEDKLAGILAKTWNKMSPLGRDEAGKLALPAPVPVLLEQGLARLRGGG